ncbi:LCP family protein [Candidatus Peregrinibacteria bacterium]|nr:LCP family protein [Candidatus Peregrinibacteria bacterium]
MSFTSRRIREERPRKSWKWPAVFAHSLKIAHPILAYYRSWKTRKHEEAKRQAFLKRVVVILIAVFLVALLLTGMAKALVALRVINVPQVLNMAGADLPVDEDGFSNILLLGQGDESHDGKDLTDMLMVASIDQKTKSVVLLSLPRDLYFLRTEQMGAGRINSLYRDYKSYLVAQGKPEPEASMEAIQELAKEVGRAADLPIHHVVKVDFIGFVKAVDALGGVDLEVPYDIVDTEYPGPNYTYQTFEIRAGPQHLDGETALKYVRSRHTTSDYGRSARQQQLLSALGQQVKEEGLSPGKIASLYNILQEHLETTLTLREMVGAAKLGSEIDRSRILTMQLNDVNGLYGEVIEAGGFLYVPPRDQFEGAFVLLPVSIPEFPVTWKQIQTLSDLLFRTRSIYLSAPQVHVLNAGARSGLGRRLGIELIRYGFAVDRIENAGIEKQATSFIAIRNEADRPFGEFFSTLLGLPLGPLPANLPPEKIGQVTIVVGQDYVYKLLQDLVASGN